MPIPSSHNWKIRSLDLGDIYGNLMGFPSKAPPSMSPQWPPLTLAADVDTRVLYISVNMECTTPKIAWWSRGWGYPLTPVWPLLQRTTRVTCPQRWALVMLYLSAVCMWLVFYFFVWTWHSEGTNVNWRIQCQISFPCLYLLFHTFKIVKTQKKHCPYKFCHIH